MGSPGERKISFAVNAERSDSIHSSTTSISIDPANPPHTPVEERKGKYITVWFTSILAHLSQRLMGELIVYQLLWRLSVHSSTFSNIFSSETTGPFKLKFHMETP